MISSCFRMGLNAFPLTLFVCLSRWFRTLLAHKEPQRIPPALNAMAESSMRVYVKNGRHLVIKEASESDSGSYEMILSSIAGRVSVPFQIMVSCEYFGRNLIACSSPSW